MVKIQIISRTAKAVSFIKFTFVSGFECMKQNDIMIQKKYQDKVCLKIRYVCEEKSINLSDSGHLIGRPIL